MLELRKTEFVTRYKTDIIVINFNAWSLAMELKFRSTSSSLIMCFCFAFALEFRSVCCRFSFGEDV